MYLDWLLGQVAELCILHSKQRRKEKLRKGISSERMDRACWP